MKLKQIMIIAILTYAALGCKSSTETKSESEIHEHEESATPRPASPRTAAMANIGPAHVHIDYSSPSVRGRVVWGGLVAYDKVWVTGAHKATSINFPKDVKINNEVVKAGKYGFFTIPGKEKWTIILNTNWDQHLADDYDQGEDVLRFDVTPEISEMVQEQLTFNVVSTDGNKGKIDFAWDKIRISIPIETI